MSTASDSRLGVSFSWEDRPGIPKPQPRRPACSTTYLTPPPAGRRRHGGAGGGGGSVRWTDPFAVALLECSRDAGDSKKEAAAARRKVVSRNTGAGVWSLSRRMGMLNLQELSCKRSCGVSESVVVLPRSRRP